MWKKKRINRGTIPTDVGRKKRLSRNLVIFSSIVFVLFILFAFFTRQGIFTIKHIETQIKEAGCIDDSKLKDFPAFKGQNLLLLNTAKVTTYVKKQYVCVKSLAISRSLPDKIKVDVFFRQPLMVLATLKERSASPSSLILNIATPSAKDLENSYLVDDEGVVFANNIEEVNIPRIFIYYPGLTLGNKLEDNLIAGILKIFDKAKSFNLSILQGWITDNVLLINTISGPKVIFRLDGSIDVQLASLQLILTEAKINRRTISSNDERNRRTISSNDERNRRTASQSEEGNGMMEFIDLRFDKPVIKITPLKK